VGIDFAKIFTHAGSRAANWLAAADLSNFDAGPLLV
jgi:hypothetical protein